MRIWFAILASMSMAACSTGAINGRWPYPVEPAAASGLGEEPLREHQVDLPALLESELEAQGVRVNTDGSSRAQFDQLVAMVDQAKRPEDIRRDVAAAWINASTANCNVYLQALRSGQVSSRLMTDFFSGAFATAASLATPPASADILAGLSAFSTAQGSSVDRNIFAQQGAELVAEAIVQIRAERRAQIESRLRRPYNEYPLGLTLADLYEFHGDCSMLRGFARMREAVVAREQTVQSVREAAAAVQRSGGGPEQIVAALSALERAPETGSGLLSSPSLDADLSRFRSDGLKCLELASAALTTGAAADADGALAAAADACGARGWSNGFTAKANEALKASEADILARLADVAAARGALPADQTTSDALTEADAALKAAMEEALAEYNKRADQFSASAIASRRLLILMLDSWDPTRPADDVAAAIRGIGGALISTNPGEGDPVFDLALAAAEETRRLVPTATSAMIARQARSAAMAAIEAPSADL